jgi:phage antirepressor YoqD-like protein
MSRIRCRLETFTYQCPECGNKAPITKQMTGRNTHRSVHGHIKDLWCYVCQKETKHVQLSKYEEMKPEVDMNELVKTELKNQRVLTTQQLADCYQTDSKVISNNFNRNLARYQFGVHYFRLEGQDKTDFLNLHQIEDGSKNAQFIYLWTEKGALLHAKSLGTDRAWNVYEQLVDTYFRYRELVQPQYQIPQSFAEALRLAADLSEQKALLETKVTTMEPKAEFHDKVSMSTGDMSIREAAKLLGTGEKRLFALLRGERVLDSHNVANQYYIDQGYFRLIGKTFYNKGTEADCIYNQSVVTGKGLIWLRKY